MKTKLLAPLFILFTLSACSEKKFDYLYTQKKGSMTNRLYTVKEIVSGGAVDVLWVIDNSGSMDKYQQQVIANANLFMQDFIQQQLDWKMGLISTDEDENPYIGFSNGPQLDASLADPVTAFSQAVQQLGTSGSATEKTFTPILKALSNDPNFERTDTTLAVIMVTDAEEQSRVDPQDFLDQLKVITGKRAIFAYGVFASRDQGCQSDEGQWNYLGSPYEGFIKGVNLGRVYPLCNNFGATLAEIGRDIVSQVTKPTIYLLKRPLISSLRVLYNNIELIPGPSSEGGKWTYNARRNAITFNSLDFATNGTDAVKVLFEEDIGQ